MSQVDLYWLVILAFMFPVEAQVYLLVLVWLVSAGFLPYPSSLSEAVVWYFWPAGVMQLMRFAWSYVDEQAR